MSDASDTALLVTAGRFRTPDAKTAHGLVRGPSRYRLVGLVDDDATAGDDAGRLLDGLPRGIPVFADLERALAAATERPNWCVVGVATSGGVISHELRALLLGAARAGLSIVNGLHDLVGDDAEIRAAAERAGARLVDLRRPKPFRELVFWSGAIRGVRAPRVAVLGTDCALGKRTTCQLLAAALAQHGVRAEVVTTGQTGWLQGSRYGFVLDATPNDFVSGELERAVVACDRDLAPDLILIEGQSALRNPSGPCGAELLLSAEARTVVLAARAGAPLLRGPGGAGQRDSAARERDRPHRPLRRARRRRRSQPRASRAGAPRGDARRDRAGDRTPRRLSRCSTAWRRCCRRSSRWSRAFDLRAPLRLRDAARGRADQPYAIASGTTAAVELVTVRVEADDGTAGVGAATPEPSVTGETFAACFAALAPERTAALAGADLDAFGAVAARVARDWGATPAAAAALDMALHDLRARAWGRPLVDLLGRVHAVLPTSITIGILPLDESLAQAERHVARGFLALKLKIGGDLDGDLERLARVRELVGPAVALRVDANCGYAPRAAAAPARRL
jgi:uncharacterized NAD-dependent epimerase/dehydratase family protein